MNKSPSAIINLKNTKRNKGFAVRLDCTECQPVNIKCLTNYNAHMYSNVCVYFAFVTMFCFPFIYWIILRCGYQLQKGRYHGMEKTTTVVYKLCGKNIFYTRCSCRVDKLQYCAIILTWSFALYYKLHIKIVLFSLMKLHNLPWIFVLASFAIVNSSHVVFRTSVAETFTKSLVRISRSPHSCYLVDTNSRQKELLHHS